MEALDGAASHKPITGPGMADRVTVYVQTSDSVACINSSDHLQPAHDPHCTGSVKSQESLPATRSPFGQQPDSPIR